MTQSNPAAATSSPGYEKGQKGLAFLIVTVTALAVGWVQYRFGSIPHLSYDEAWHVYLGKIGPAWKNLLAISGDVHPPIYYLLLRPFFLIGRDPIYARALTMGLTVLTIPLMYGLLRRMRIAVPVALVTIIVLASSVSFLHLGVTVRQYSVAVFFLLAGLWFWASMLPISNSRPRRRFAIASLLLFAFAFANLYAILFATAALFGSMLLIMLLSGRAREQIGNAWRQHSRWPEWTLFALAHIAVLIWYYVGWVAHISAETPNHVQKYQLADGQSVLDFLINGLHLEAALFTPLFKLDPNYVNMGLVAILATILWLVIHNLRRGNYLHATLALAPVALTAILAFGGVTHHYPFGGDMRHQYVLFPFLLLLIPLALHSIWHRLPNVWIKGIILAVILAIAAHNTQRTLDYRSIGEAPAGSPWQEAYEELFATAPEVPIMIPAYALFWTYTNRFIQHDKYAMYYRGSYDPDPRGFHLAYQGWLSILMPWASYEEYGVITEDGSEALLLKDSYRWLFDAQPDDLFYGQTQAMIEATNSRGIRIFSPLAGNEPANEEELRAQAQQHGFTLTEFMQIDDAVIWTLMLDAAQPAAPAVPQPAPVTPVSETTPVSDQAADATTAVNQDPVREWRP